MKSRKWRKAAVFPHCASETGRECIWRTTSPMILPSSRGGAKLSGNGVCSRSGGLIFEGKATDRKSRDSHPLPRTTETLADDASLAVPIGRVPPSLRRPFHVVEVIAAHAQKLAVRVHRTDVARPDARLAS